MSRADEVYRQIQRPAREASLATGTPAPTREYVLPHALESFLERLTRTQYADAVVLKGGILLAAYGARRPTKDVDTNLSGADVNSGRRATPTSLARGRCVCCRRGNPAGPRRGTALSVEPLTPDQATPWSPRYGRSLRLTLNS